MAKIEKKKYLGVWLFVCIWQYLTLIKSNHLPASSLTLISLITSLNMTSYSHHAFKMYQITNIGPQEWKKSILFDLRFEFYWSCTMCWQTALNFYFLLLSFLPKKTKLPLNCFAMMIDFKSIHSFPLAHRLITVRYTAPVDNIIWKRDALQPIGQKIVKLLYDMNFEANPIILHVFSNGGAYLYKYIDLATKEFQSPLDVGFFLTCFFVAFSI